MDIPDYNREAWDGFVEKGNQWTVPVSVERVNAAREGSWKVLLTSTKPVPAKWFPPLKGLDLLGLACGGGQQGPLFAAAGAHVTIFDNSPRMLQRDQEVAEREGLSIATVQGDMADLSAFADNSFDLIFNPCSNCFVPNVLPVWQECFRVLRSGGILMTGFANPALFIFDHFKACENKLVVRHRLPYSDLTSITEEERAKLRDMGEPLAFGHTLADQIGGQIAAGFHIDGFYDDICETEYLSQYMPVYMATRAVKP